MRRNSFKSIIAKITAAALVVAGLILPASEVPVMAGEDHYLHNVYISVNGSQALPARAVDCQYRNNVYVSLRDVAALLAGTEVAFSVRDVDKVITITTGEMAEDRPLVGWQDSEKEAFTAKETTNNSLTVNDSTRKYNTLRADYGDGTDFFIRFASLCLMFDMNVEDVGKDTYNINTAGPISVNPGELENYGFFSDLNSILVGDATTGEVFYEYNGKEPYAIASTTKLMTYLLTEEAIARGELSEDSLVTISEEASLISESEDGNTKMVPGGEVSVRELIIGSLLPSSNECAFLLGEKIGGDTKTFVDMMNNRAAELGLDSALFFNANGLPDYSESGLASKNQNVMNAEDMFKMCSYILNTFPQIKEVTSMKDASLNSINAYVRNTNELLYNMPEVTGLKTGTTDRAGCCLITSLTANDGVSDHDLIVVLLGAENNKTRFTTSELMAHYAKNVVTGLVSSDGISLSDSSGSGETVKKLKAGELVDMIVKEAMKR